MGRAARVTSTDAVDTVTAAVRRFQEDSVSALEDLEMEVQRALDWICHDRKDYWTEQVRRGSERQAEAKIELQKSQTFRRVGDYRPACREEKKALEMATRRLRLAEEKLERVRHWARAIDHAVKEYKGGIQQLARCLETDVPRALAALERIGRALESYIALQSTAETLTPDQFPSLAADGAPAAPAPGQTAAPQTEASKAEAVEKEKEAKP